MAKVYWVLSIWQSQRKNQKLNTKVVYVISKWIRDLKLCIFFLSCNTILIWLGYLVFILIDLSPIIYCYVTPIIDFIINYFYTYMFATVWFFNLCSFLDATNIFISYHSGDVDMAIPYVGTETWIKSLNLTIESGWQPWFVDGQVAGLVYFDRVNFSLFLT